jgi:hypothetical protein
MMLLVTWSPGPHMILIGSSDSCVLLYGFEELLLASAQDNSPRRIENGRQKLRWRACPLSRSP